MQIAKEKVVSIDYTLKNDEGEVLDTSEGNQPLIYLHGAMNIIPGLEAALEGKAVSDELSVRIEPKDAYGERDEDKQQAVPKTMFGETDIQVGAQYHAASPDGQAVVVTVVAAEGDNIVVDGNHPLAGVPLNFDVKVLEVREATEEELDHGHVHDGNEHH